MIRAERSFFIGLFIALWAYIILRALLIPWVHDESTSLYWFLERETFLPYVALWDAGNHFLSSAIGVLGHKLWGLSLFGSRVGSVFAFPLFVWAVYRIGSLLNDRLVRWCLWLALLACPFLIEFFSLFRGYGLGMAFFLVAVDGAIRYRAERQTKHLVQILIGFAMADFAVLSLVPVWALVVAVLGVDLGVNWRNTRTLHVRKAVLWVLFGVVPLLFGLLLSWEMRRRGLLYHGSLDGFLPVTLASLCKYVLGSVHPVVLFAAATSVIAATAALLLRSAWRAPLLVIAAMLWADVCMRIGMALVLGVNYPEDRAALHLVPLAILLVAFAVDALAHTNIRWRWAALILLVLPLRTVLNANLDHTVLWPEQSVPARFIQRVSELQAKKDRPLTIGVYHELSMALPYAARLQGALLNPPDAQGFPNAPTDLRIVDDRFLEEALDGYREVDVAPGPGLHLLERLSPVVLDTVEWTTFSFEESDREFLEIWRSEGLEVVADQLFTVECSLWSSTSFLDLHLVVEQKRSDELLHYHTTRIATISPRWSGERLRVLVRMPAVPEADTRVVYFWSPEHHPIAMGDGRVGRGILDLGRPMTDMLRPVVLPSRKQVLLFAALAALVAIHLVVRAFAVPITYEEAWRFFAWVQPAAQPLDHQMSSWWAMVTNALMGPALFPQRFLSLLAFVLFARYAFLLGALVQDLLLRWCLWLALLLMPFAVEFFALAGGQSLAMAFLFMGLWHLGRIPEEDGSRHVLWSTLAFIGVAFSTAAMLPAWLVGELAVLVVLLRSGSAGRWSRLGAWALLTGVSAAALLGGPNAIGTSNDWPVAEKLQHWMDLVFATHAQLLVWSLVVSLCCMAWLSVARGPAFTGTAQRTVLLAVVALLVCWPLLYFSCLLPTDLLHDALPWLPLFFLGWGLALDQAVSRARHRRWIGLLLLLPALYMVLGIHVGTTRSSGDGAIPPKFAQEVLRRQQEAGRGLVVGGGVRQMLSWEYGRLFDDEPLTTLQTDPVAMEESDLLLVSRSDADAASQFRTVLEGPGGLTLMVRNSAHSTTTVLDTSISLAASDAEFRELPLPAAATIAGHALSFDLTGVLLLERRPSEGPFLVVEVNDSEMGHAYYNSRSIGQYPRGQRGLPLRITHVLPVIPMEAQRVAIYIWNPARVPLSLDKARLHILQRNTPEPQAKE